MATLNSILRGLTNLIMTPFGGMPAIVSLVLISIPCTLLALYVFKWTSDQDKIEAVKRDIFGGLFEIRLFNDNLGLILRAIGSILRHNARYVALSSVPLVVMIVPFVLVVAQLQFQYGYDGLKPGETALVKVELDPDWAVTYQDGKPPIELLTPEGLQVTTSSMWAWPINELSWHIQADTPGTYEMQLAWEGDKVTKTVDVTDAETALRSPIRHAGGFLDAVLYPAEDPLPATAPIKRIEVSYTDASIRTFLFGIEIHWLIVFLVLTVVMAFALAKPLGIKL